MKLTATFLVLSLPLLTSATPFAPTSTGSGTQATPHVQPPLWPGQIGIRPPRPHWPYLHGNDGPKWYINPIKSTSEQEHKKALAWPGNINAVCHGGNRFSAACMPNLAYQWQWKKPTEKRAAFISPGIIPNRITPCDGIFGMMRPECPNYRPRPKWEYIHRPGGESQQTVKDKRNAAPIISPDLMICGAIGGCGPNRIRPLSEIFLDNARKVDKRALAEDEGRRLGMLLARALFE